MQLLRNLLKVSYDIYLFSPQQYKLQTKDNKNLYTQSITYV